jgi:hypothetical protein
MNAEVVYDLYEEPSRWSRVVVVCCIILVAILALWIVAPPLLSRLLPTSEPPLHKDIVAPPPAQTIVAITKSAREGTADPAMVPAATVSAPAPATPIATDTRSSTPPTSGQDGPTTPETAVRPAENASTTADSVSVAVWSGPQVVHSAGPAALAREADAEPVARPPLPRARPRLTVAGTLPIPLPHPRPFIPTPEATESAPATIIERPNTL